MRLWVLYCHRFVHRYHGHRVIATSLPIKVSRCTWMGICETHTVSDAAEATALLTMRRHAMNSRSLNEHPRHLVLPAEIRCNAHQISLISRSSVFPVNPPVFVCSTYFSIHCSKINHPYALLYIIVHGSVCVTTPGVRAQFKAHRHGIERERQKETKRKRERTYVMISKRMKREKWEKREIV